MAVTLLGVVAAWTLTGCEPSGPTPATSSAPAAAPGSATPAAAGSGAATGAVDGAVSGAEAGAGDLAKVLGRWLRPDGGYILELRDLDAATGRMNATYLNPQPIHVAQAEVKRDGGKVRVFVELQDVNYPGCTYRLNYFPATDQLYGVYYQAALQQSFDVEFERQK